MVNCTTNRLREDQRRSQRSRSRSFTPPATAPVRAASRRLMMRGFIKAAGPRTVVTGSTGCMYVANTCTMTTPWIVPWMHTQLGAGGSSAVGMAAGLRALKRKGKIKDEKINVIASAATSAAATWGSAASPAPLQTDYDLLIIMYDNESAANTDIQRRV